MSSKLVTVNSFVKVSFLCDFEMSTTKMCDKDALSFLMKFDLGKYRASSFIDDNDLNSIYQVNPLDKIINSIVTTHLNGENAGLVVTVDDYNTDTNVKPEFKLPWVNIVEFAAVSSLSTHFCKLKLFKSPDGGTFMLKGSAPSFMTEHLRTAYGSAKDVCTEFEYKYQRSLESYVSMLEKAGASCIGLPDTLPDVYTVHTEVGDVTIYRDDRTTKYGSMTHTVHMPWKPFAVRVCFKGTDDLQEWVYKELLEALWVELDIY